MLAVGLTLFGKNAGIKIPRKLFSQNWKEYKTNIIALKMHLNKHYPYISGTV